jgi:hypothetical protein
MRHRRLIVAIKSLLRERTALLCRVFLCVAVMAVTIPIDAAAYVDPGTTGMLSQILYVLFYGALGLFFYFLRYIKQYFTNAKQSLAKLFGARQ